MQAGDVGVIINFKLPYPATGATVTLVARKPNGAVAAWPTTISDDGATASLETTGSDFDQPGEFVLQLFSDWGDNRIRHGRQVRITVGENITLESP